ncbi:MULTISPECIES: hypothetical protein [unclassified Streptomyces]|uniref:hypothetical protein n=1 Tax=unclassified Streptomyces TaxID=2593676 RepID=UPI003320948D
MAAVNASERDRQDGERFPQVFEPVDLRQCLLEVRRSDSLAPAGLGLKSKRPVAGSQLPHLVMDLLPGFRPPTGRAASLTSAPQPARPTPLPHLQ